MPRVPGLAVGPLEPAPVPARPPSSGATARRGGSFVADARSARSVLRAVLFGGRSVPDWHERAACTSTPTALFFPESARSRESNAAVRTAKRVCAGCAVREQCLADVMAYESPSHRYGVVGGTSPAERSRRPARRTVTPAPEGAVVRPASSEPRR